MRKILLMAVPAAMLTLCVCCAQAAGPWQTTRKVAEFDRFDLVRPDMTEAVRKRNELKSDAGPVSGAVECDVEFPETDWFELLAEPGGWTNY
jgi:hypothetical protein